MSGDRRAATDERLDAELPDAPGRSRRVDVRRCRLADDDPWDDAAARPARRDAFAPADPTRSSGSSGLSMVLVVVLILGRRRRRAGGTSARSTRPATGRGQSAFTVNDDDTLESIAARLGRRGLVVRRRRVRVVRRAQRGSRGHARATTSCDPATTWATCSAAAHAARARPTPR